jgi:hypothetical protein
MAVREFVGSGIGLRCVTYATLSIGLGCGAIYSAVRAVDLTREAKRSHMPEPTAAPDFSTLSDGSQHARNLEDVR